MNSGNTVNKMGRNPGLEVMGGDSCSKGRDFESRRHILDGHFFTFICSKNCNVCLKLKRGRGWPNFIEKNTVNKSISNN